MFPWFIHVIASLNFRLLVIFRFFFLVQSIKIFYDDEYEIVFISLFIIVVFYYFFLILKNFPIYMICFVFYDDECREKNENSIRSYGFPYEFFFWFKSICTLQFIFFSFISLRFPYILIQNGRICMIWFDFHFHIVDTCEMFDDFVCHHGRILHIRFDFSIWTVKKTDTFTKKIQDSLYWFHILLLLCLDMFFSFHYFFNQNSFTFHHLIQNKYNQKWFPDGNLSFVKSIESGYYYPMKRNDENVKWKRKREMENFANVLKRLKTTDVEYSIPFFLLFLLLLLLLKYS